MLIARAHHRASSAAPLDRLSAAATTAAELSARADALLDRFVAEARAAGSSWTEIGVTLGVSKQAAHQRFLSAAAPASAVRPSHGTPAVRSAVAAGERQACELGHAYLGTEHVLVGLLEQPGTTAAAALATIGVRRDDVFDRLVAIIGAGTAQQGSCHPIAPRLKRGFELARSYARALGSGVFDTEHVLLAFCDMPDCVAAVILCERGAPAETVRSSVAAQLGVDASTLRSRSQRRRVRRAKAV